MNSGAGANDQATKALSEIDQKLNLLNKPGIKTINSEDGDIIDCVDINKQHALEHPALKNHQIQLKPSISFPAEEKSTKNESSRPVIFQTWQKSGSCPEGTIPIRRTRREDLLRAESLERFGMKSHEAFTGTKKMGSPNDSLLVTAARRSRATLITLGYNYIGAQGIINIWNPHVQSPGEYTTAQIWMKAGPGASYESVEAGWMVHPQLYGDGRSRLFISWTVDAYDKSGCFNLLCSGFVQTSSKFVLGAALEPTSSWRTQYDYPIAMNLDPNTGNWWLLGQNEGIGYWPGTLFGYLKHSAIVVEWGGQVFSPNVLSTPHTKTQMGSGDFASGHLGNACYIKGVRIIDYSKSLKYPEWVGSTSDEPYCYSAQNFREGIVGEPVFFFGGPGQNFPYCK
ncbi:uncharacterized protein LOC120006061 [Tripterygium wilfordii]|nr:uncharacterized protein LOC120006061 [Tripterygium wilfordii]